jgi:hypothetical protein
MSDAGGNLKANQNVLITFAKHVRAPNEGNANK